MRKAALIFVAFMIIFPACKSEKDSVVTFADGKISRGEFYNWLDTRRISRDNLLKKKSKQKLRLRQMAIEKLSVDAALKAGYDKNPDYKKLIEMVRGNFIASFYQRQVQNNQNFKEEAARVKMIKFRVKNYNIVNNKRKKISEKELEVKFQEQIKKADDVLLKLKAGEDFSELAKKYSHDYSRNKKNGLGYIIRGMKNSEFTDEVFKLKEGEYSAKPVRIKNAVYILKVDKKETLTPDNINDVIENEKKAKRMKRRIQFASLEKLKGTLRSSSDVVSNIEKSTFRNPAEKLFQYGDKTYTVADFNKVIAFINEKRSEQGREIKPLTLDQKRKFTDKILRDKLYEREAVKNNILKDKKYLNEWKRYSDFTLANLYKEKILKNSVSVTEDEVKEEYYKIKNRNKKNKRRKSMPQKSYNEMKKTIKKRLENRKKSLERKKWESDLLKSKKFTILVDELEGE